MATRKTTKRKKRAQSEVVTITISRACAEELYIAIANALTASEGGKKKGGGFGGGGKGGWLLQASGLPGNDDTPGYDLSGRDDTHNYG